MHPKFLITLFFSLLFSFQSFSADYLEKYYQNYSLELHGLRIRNAENGGYYILANSLGQNRLDYVSKQLIKTDSLGNQLWMMEVDGQEGPPGHMNSDFIISRDTFIYVITHHIGCYSDGSISKLDKNGNVLYNTDVLGLTFPDSKLTAITGTSNNDVLIGGYISQGTECDVRFPFLAKMNPDGTLAWQTYLDTILYSGISISGLSNFSDTSYIVNLSNATSILINDAGQIISSNFPQGRFIVTTFSNYIIQHPDYLEKVDSSLTPIWQTPPFSNMTILDLTTDSHGSVFISGRKDTCNGEMFIATYDSAGNNLWTKTYGGDLNDAGECIMLTDEDHIVSIGTHSIHEWSVFEHVSLECILYVTHTAKIRLVKLPKNILSGESVNSSSGRYDLCPGDSIILSAPSGFSYLWNTGETTQEIVADTTGLYSVTIENLSGDIEPLPEFNTYLYPVPTLVQMPDVTFTQCSGTFDFCMGLPYNDSIYDRDYNWHSSAVPYVVSYDPSNGDPYNGLNAATYYCVVSNVCGSDTSAYYNLFAIPPTVSLGPDTIICVNDSILLTANTSAFRPHFTWQDGTHDDQFLATDTIHGSINLYVITVEDEAGCTSSDSIVVTFDNCTTVNELNNYADAKIYPNPFTDQFVLENFNLNSEINLFDEMGNIILTKVIKSKTEVVSISEVSNGIYFIRIKDQDNITFRKILKSTN